MRTIITATNRRTARLSTLAVGAVVTATALVTLTGCGSSDSSDSADEKKNTTASATKAADPVTVKDAWVKTAESGNSAVFGTLVNSTDKEITVISATASVSSRVELHEVTEVDGKMMMRPKEGGYVIPAKGEHVLKPGADHVMLMGINKAVKPGDQVTVTMTFKDGDTLKFTAVGKDFAGGNEKYKPGMKKG